MAYPFSGYTGATDCYNPENPLSQSEPSYLPNTLKCFESFPVPPGILALPEEPYAYDLWLQNYLDATGGINFNDKFTKTMKLADGTSKLAEKSFINIVQTHLAYNVNDLNTVYALREPTNEETMMMTNLSITYGAKGMFYFWWGSWGILGSTNYGRSLAMETDNTKRVENVYGQFAGQNSSKIGTVAEINDNISYDKWGKYLMSFNNEDRHSYIYRNPDERA